MIELKTNRLLLRNPRQTDLADWHRLMSDQKTMYYLNDISTKSEQESHANLAKAIEQAANPDRTKCFFAIESLDNGAFIGNIGYSVLQSSTAGNIVHAGYFTLPEFHGNGYATEALSELMRYAFEQENVYRLQTGCITENCASKRVMQKCGLICEGIQKSAEWHDGQFKDRVSYRILRPEWEKMISLSANAPQVIHDRCRTRYTKIESYMLTVMNDSTHDKEHIYRVLYAALDIAQTVYEVDMEILTVACLLHDIGRETQFNDPSVCHAVAGGRIAYDYLISIGWSVHRAKSVKSAIISHRFKGDNPPNSIEAKILFDADKLDATGALGIARTFTYIGKVSGKNYSTDEEGYVIRGEDDTSDSFLHEYKFKLENIFDNFFTEKGKELALKRQKTAADFYNIFYHEISTLHKHGIALAAKRN